ncbi:MAG: amino acid-binding protein [Alteromonadaceae bacterium]|nr:amino acid-binding protein [Alteromonadaceae bacterium]
MKHLIISFISPDRPGIVDRLSDTIKNHGGNWQQSSMHHMSGFFSGVLQISIEEQKSELLIDEIQKIEHLETLIKLSNAQDNTELTTITLELTANDRSGIVQEISSVIYDQGGNLIKLVSVTESAAHSGQRLFKAKATVAVLEKNTDELIAALENLADDLMVDISQ